jgi:hypothetical protein
VREGALCVKERCVKERGGSGGDGTAVCAAKVSLWLARLVLMMCVLVNGICARAVAGSVQGEANGVTGRGGVKKAFGSG